MTTTPENPDAPLEDTDIETVTGSAPQPETGDADGTDGLDADRPADGGDADGTDGDTTDGGDADGTDGTDGDASDG